MNNLRIIIVTYNWPPRNAIGTFRPYYWAKAWSNQGCILTVLTAQKQTFDEPLDLNLPILPNVEVIQVPWSNGFHRLVLNILTPSKIRSLARKIKNSISQHTSSPVEPRRGWLNAALPVARRLASDADIVISTFGPSISHQLGSAMKQLNPNLIWVADYRDLWSQAHLVNLTPDQRASIRATELASVGMHADLLTAVSEDMVTKLRSLTGKEVFLAPNGFDIDEDALIARLRIPKQIIQRSLRIVHTGLLYEGSRNPEPLLLALDELWEEGLIREGVVIVEFYGARIDVAYKLAKNPRYSRFIRLKGHVPHAQALKAQRDADVLLLLEDDKEEARGVLTGKIFEYITTGVPIISIGSKPDFEIPKLLKRTGTGTSFERKERHKLKSFLINLLDGKSAENCHKPNIYEIIKYSRSRQAEELLRKIISRIQ